MFGDIIYTDGNFTKEKMMQVATEILKRKVVIDNHKNTDDEGRMFKPVRILLFERSDKFYCCIQHSETVYQCLNLCYIAEDGVHLSTTSIGGVIHPAAGNVRFINVFNEEMSVWGQKIIGYIDL